MNKRKGILITLAVIIICILAAVLCFGGRLRWRMYTGDRIKGTVCVYIDGAQYTFDPADVKQADSVRINDSGAVEYSLKADEYGAYTVGLGKCGTEKDIYLKYHQFNWWNVYRSDITLNIDIKENTVTCKGYSTSLDEWGHTVRTDIDKTLAMDEENVFIFLGSV